MSGKHKEQILELYTAPFTHTDGYIFDAKSQMIVDDCGANLEGIVQVRGWGYLNGKLNLDDAGDIQDEIGEMIAEALTQYWNKEKQ